jgi:hypothetical protein
LKVRFDKKSLNITSQRFNPFNFSIYGIDVKAEKNENQVDPFQMLENLAAKRKPGEDVTYAEDVRVMQSMINK